MDNLTPDIRRQTMSRVRSKDTKPEWVVRRLVHSMGYRYRLHRADLPGKPDLVFPKYRKAIFVNGCFWHGHQCRAGRNRPASNKDYWLPKLEKNKTRDRSHYRRLRKMGWGIMVIWECQIKKTEVLKKRIRRFLGAGADA
ncbi:MAG: very short patch repair endonuclease [Candidatus Omnitrophota bacterium]